VLVIILLVQLQLNLALFGLLSSSSVHFLVNAILKYILMTNFIIIIILLVVYYFYCIYLLIYLLTLYLLTYTM